MSDHADQRAALYHWLKGIELAGHAAGRALFMCDLCAGQAEQASSIVSPAQLAQANGRPVVDQRTAMLQQSEAHRRAGLQELNNLLAFAGQLAQVLNPPKADDATVGGRLNGLHLAD